MKRDCGTCQVALRHGRKDECNGCGPGFSHWRIRYELEKAQQPQPAPVAVVKCCVAGPAKDGVRITWLAGFPQIGDKLYAAPQASMRPLTLEYIEQHIGPDEGDREAVLEVVRQVERAHKIGVKP